MAKNETNNLSNYMDYKCHVFWCGQVVVDPASLLLEHDVSKILSALAESVVAWFLNDDVIISLDSALTSGTLESVGLAPVQVKTILPQLPPEIQEKILKSYQRVNWHYQSKYCGRCGAAMVYNVTVTEKTCSSCNAVVFPRFSPAIMVLIQDEDRILLARSPHFPNKWYSVLAGFVDIGESVEQAIHREVQEEVGLKIKNLKYFSSQAWPFPDSLMIAFKAEYDIGSINIDNDEIEDAQWFTRKNLPELPPTSSIARMLIDSADI